MTTADNWASCLNNKLDEAQADIRVNELNGVIIYREVLGGSEEINLGTPEGYHNFCAYIIQDYDYADELINRMIGGETEIVLNGNESEYIERYTLTSTIKPIP